MATYYDKTECVRDNSTGLIWQGQTAAGAGTLRDNDKRYTNYDSTTIPQKWDGTNLVIPNQSDIDAATNSIGFKNAINTSNLCGGNDWRVPALNELACLVVGDETPYIDLFWFPNTVVGKPPYWTSTTFDEFQPRTYSPLTTILGLRANYINFEAGYVDYAVRYSEMSVRLVRGNASKTCSLAGAT